MLKNLTTDSQQEKLFEMCKDNSEVRDAVVASDGPLYIEGLVKGAVVATIGGLVSADDYLHFRIKVKD